MICVRVPATSANMGAGFDTLGIAFNLYSRLEIEEINSGLEIVTINNTGCVQSDKSNLVYRAMEKVFDKTGYTPSGLKITQKSKIPMTRGLGSSAACIIGGMLAANALSGRQLSYPEMLNMATEMEGHPDNVGPAMYGGFCVSASDSGNTMVKSFKLNSGLKFAVMVPGFFVATKKSRGILPDFVTIQDAASNISASAMFQAALVTGDYDLLKYGVRDRIHQPFRKGYVDGFDDIFKKTYDSGSKATYLSGSGPTIVSILTDDAENFRKTMEQFFVEHQYKWRCMILECDNVGAVVSER